MKFSRSLILIGTTLSLILTSGCTETKTGTPSVSGMASSTSASGKSSAPKVARPLSNISTYVDKPCELVPQSLITQLGYSDPTPSAATSNFGPGCGWIDVRTAQTKNFNVAIGIFNGEGNGGIAKIISLNGSLFSFVEPTQVSDYPAAYADTADHRAEGKCGLYVGVTDDVTFAVDVDGYQNEQDSCGAAKQIAAAVITTLQGGS